MEATQSLDLFLVHGASRAEATYRVAELCSPPRATAEMGSMPDLGLLPGSTYDLRRDRHGRAWNFLRADHRRRA